MGKLTLKSVILESFLFRSFTLKELTEKAADWLDSQGVKPEDTEKTDQMVGEQNLEDCVKKRLETWKVQDQDKPPKMVYPGFSTAGEAAKALCLWFNRVSSGDKELDQGKVQKLSGEQPDGQEQDQSREKKEPEPASAMPAYGQQSYPRTWQRGESVEPTLKNYFREGEEEGRNITVTLKELRFIIEEVRLSIPDWRGREKPDYVVESEKMVGHLLPKLLVGLNRK